MSARRLCVLGVVALGVVWGAAWVMAGNLDPSEAPNPTMHSLDEIYLLLTNMSNQIGMTPAPVAKTGQTNSYAGGDDGANKAGRSWWDGTRFAIGTDSSTNCVTDKQTGLMWVKSPPSYTTWWTDALDYCNNLAGADGRGGYTDWRLPNWNELRSLLDASQFGPALPPGHPFSNIYNGYYWSSTTCATNANNAWLVDLNIGQVNEGNKYITDTSNRIWPVRGP